MSGKRHEFVGALYELGRDLEHPETAPTARGELAKLRRGLNDDLRSLDVVFRHDPEQSEVDTWQLVGGLFALHPRVPADGRGVGLGAALGLLESEKSTKPRLQQLVSVHPSRVGYYARQAVQLVRSLRSDVALNYHWLLDDLVCVRTRPARHQEAYEVRLKWAREYFRAAHGARTTTSDDTVEGDTE